MSGFTKLFSTLIGSTIWRESLETKVVWITMLAVADKEGLVEYSLPGLAHAAGVDDAACAQAIEKFKQPDKYSRSKEHEGRRIEEVDGGWIILNYRKYREKGMLEARTDFYRTQKASQRAKHKNVLGQSSDLSASASASASASEEGEDCQEEETQEQAQFDAFWKAYPKKVGKVHAFKAFLKAIDKTTLDALLAAIESQKKSNAWTKDNGQFIPYPSTWLNGERWNDVLDAGGPQKASGYELLVAQKEFDRIMERQKTINNSYSENQNWSKEDREEYKANYARIQELRQTLGVKL